METIHYAKSMHDIGARLRRVREHQRLSLNDVQTLSEGEFKASIVASYERGEREINIARLKEISDFYRVPIIWLLEKDK